MQIDLLRSLDAVLVCCEVSDDAITARWVQLNPAAMPKILGSVIKLQRPKSDDQTSYLVRVPEDLTPVHTDVEFSLVSDA